MWPHVDARPRPSVSRAPVGTSENAFQAAQEVCELVAQGSINVTGAQAVLRALSARFNNLLPPGEEIPSSWYKCMKLGLDGLEPKLLLRDFCPECDYLFPMGGDYSDIDYEFCPQCAERTRLDTKRKPARQSYYIDLEDQVQRMFSSPYAAGLLRYGQNARRSEYAMEERELHDAYDGRIMESRHHQTASPYK